MTDVPTTEVLNSASAFFRLVKLLEHCDGLLRSVGLHHHSSIYSKGHIGLLLPKHASSASDPSDRSLCPTYLLRIKRILFCYSFFKILHHKTYLHILSEFWKWFAKKSQNKGLKIGRFMHLSLSGASSSLKSSFIFCQQGIFCSLIKIKEVSFCRCCDLPLVFFKGQVVFLCTPLKDLQISLSSELSRGPISTLKSAFRPHNLNLLILTF